MMEQSSTIATFCCYAHKDTDLLCELKTHLSPLERLNVIKVWDDGDISAGTEWGPEIKKHLNDAKIILLLISPSFITSDYCYSTEMQHALERHKQREARVIPIILRHVRGWERVPPGDIHLGDLQALPKDAKPVRSWTDRDEAWKEVVEGIEGAVNELLMRGPIPPAQESQDSYILSRIWSKLSPDLREVLVLAFNTSQQEASNGPIKTRHVFAALQSTPNTAKPLLAELPQEVLPRLKTSGRTLKERDLMDTEPSLSSCVEESLRERVKNLDENEEITAFDLLIQLLRTGTGSTVSQLRRAGITPDRVDDLVRSLGGEEEKSDLLPVEQEVLASPEAINVSSSAQKITFPITFTVLSGTAGDTKWIAGELYSAVGYGDGQIQIWRCATNRLISTCYGHTERVTDAAWSPDGTCLASTSDDGTVRLWKAMTGQSLAVVSRSGAQQYSNPIWSSNGMYVAVWGYYRGEDRIEILDTNSGTFVTSSLLQNNYVVSMQWFPDSIRLALISSDSTQVLETTTGHLLASYKRPESYSEIHFSPDCTYLASAAEEAIQVREVTTGHLLISYGLPSPATKMRWSPDGKYLAFALKETIQIRESLTGNLVCSYAGHKDQVRDIAWHPSGAYIISCSADNIIHVWETIVGRTIATYERHGKSERGEVWVAWSPDGKQLISSSFLSQVQVIQRATGKVSTTYSGHVGRVCAIVWSPAGTKIASGSYDNTMQIWDAKTGRCIAACIHKNRVNAITWSPDSKQIASRCRGQAEVKIWNAETGYLLATYPLENMDTEGRVAWSFDSKYIAATRGEAFDIWK